MTGADFRIDVPAMAETEKVLAGLAARMGDLSPLMETIATVLEVDTHDNFTGEHGPDGVPWLPSQRVKRSAIGKHGPQRPSLKTLQESRRLFMSIQPIHTATTAGVGTNVVYAGRHQRGFTGTEQVKSFKRRITSLFGVKLAEPTEVTVKAHTRQANTPARPFMGLSIHAREEIEGHVADYAGAEQ